MNDYLIGNVNVSDIVPGDAFEITITVNENSMTRIVRGVAYHESEVLFAFDDYFALVVNPADNRIAVMTQLDADDLTISLTVKKVSVKAKYLDDSLLMPLYDSASNEYSIRKAVEMITDQLQEIDSWIRSVIASESFDEAKSQRYTEDSIPYLSTTKPENSGSEQIPVD